MPPDATFDIRVDGETWTVPAGATILEACDAAGHYVPRLCSYPGLPLGAECGLCAVLSDGAITLACRTPVAEGLDVVTESGELAALRLDRLAALLWRHPRACLGCPDAAGCARDACTYGIPPDARCCDLFGRCELGKLVEWLDPARALQGRGAAVGRATVAEGPIRRDPGLCVGCGRCVAACSTLPGAHDVLQMAEAGGAHAVAQPKNGTLRASDCTFCGQCVLVCPAGALAASGQRGATWLAGRRERGHVADPVLPPTGRQRLSPAAAAKTPARAGVFRLLDAAGRTLLIRGVADLQRGLTEALRDPSCSAASFFELELEPLFTQRESELLAQHAHEHGSLPSANDLDDDLF